MLKIGVAGTIDDDDRGGAESVMLTVVVMMAILLSFGRWFLVPIERTHCMFIHVLYANNTRPTTIFPFPSIERDRDESGDDIRGAAACIVDDASRCS